MGKNFKQKDVYKLYYGYKVYRDATIISPQGKILKTLDLMYPGSHVVMFEIKDGKKIRHSVNVAKLVYYLHVLDKDEIPNERKNLIRFADGDSRNCTPENLIFYTKHDYCKKMKYQDKQKKFSRKQAKKIFDNYPVDSKGKKTTLKSLATKYGCSVSVVQNIIHGNYYPEFLREKEGAKV